MTNETDYMQALTAADEVGNTSSATSDEKHVYAVFSKTDGSLNFYNRSFVPEQGSDFEGKEASFVWGEDKFKDSPWLVSEGKYEKWFRECVTPDTCMELYEQGLTQFRLFPSPFGGDCGVNIGFDNCGFDDWKRDFGETHDVSENITDFVFCSFEDNPHIKSVTVVDEGIDWNGDPRVYPGIHAYGIATGFANCSNLEKVDIDKLHMIPEFDDCFEMSRSDYYGKEGREALVSVQEYMDECVAGCPKLELPIKGFENYLNAQAREFGFKSIEDFNAYMGVSQNKQSTYDGPSL